MLAGQLRTEAEAYLTEMGVPQSVIDFTWSVPGNDVAPLPREARETYFSGFVSEYQDWYNARCTSDTMGCLADTMKELQAEAYAGFFGAEPSSEARRVAREAFDVQVHPYALWIDARSFLGKTLAQFHGLTGDAFFQTMTIGGRTFTLHADQESDGQRFLSQDQRASVPRLLLVLRNGTIRDVVLDYHIDGQSDRRRQIFARVDDALKSAYGEGERSRVGSVEFKDWSLDNGRTALKWMHFDDNLTLSYRQQ